MNLTRRLYLLVGLALLPAVLIQAHHTVEARGEREARARDEALRLAVFVAAEMDRLVEGGRVLLAAAARAPAFRGPAAAAAGCSDFASDLIGGLPRYARLAAADAAGRVFCAAGPLPVAGLSWADVPWFADGLAAGGFAVPGFVRGSVSGQPLLVMTAPLPTGADGAPGGLLAVGIDLGRLAAELAAKPLPPDASISVLDRNGAILVRIPETRFAGRPIPDGFRWMLAAAAPGTTEGVGPDGIARIGGYVPPAAGASGLLTTVALSRTEAMAGVEAATRRGVLLILAGTALAALAAGVGGELFVRRPVAALAAAVERLGRGDRGARALLPGGRSELARLGAAIDGMAAGIAAREAELVESEARIRRAVEGATVPILFHADDGEVLAVSDGLVRITGYGRDRLRSFAGWTELAYGERAGAMAAAAARRFAGERLPLAERRVRTAGGEERVWLLETAPPERLRDGRLALFAVMSDVTELKRHEAALALSEARLRLVLAAGRMGVGLWDIRAGQLRWDATLHALFGTDPARFVPRPDRVPVHPDDAERVRAAAGAALEGPAEAHADEFRIVRADDGEVRWLAVRAGIARDPAGRPLAVTAVHWDVTDGRRAETAARGAGERLRLALAAGRMGAWDWDVAGGTVLLDPLAARLLGADAAAAPSPGDLLALLHPDDRAAVRRRAARALARGRPFEAEFRTRPAGGGDPAAAAGSSRRLHARAEASRDPATGRPARLTGVVADVTERRAWEARQRLLTEELDHRVKNTLAVIQGLAQRSAAHAADLPGFTKGFLGRVQAMAAAHDALARSGWRGAELGAVADAALAPFLGGEDGGRVALDLPALRLRAPAAQALTLALHELATNAAKYGALSAPGGRVSLGAERLPGEGVPTLRLVWREAGGPPARPPERRGFGSTLVTRALPHQTGGRVELDWRPEGLVCRMDLPLEEVLEPAAA